MQNQMRIIEDHLNKLCSQHDQLMNLLDIYDYIPNAKGLFSINRNIGNKIVAYEQQINQVIANQESSEIKEDSFIRNKEQLLNASLGEAEEKIHEIKVNITSFKDTNRNIEEKLRQEYASDNNTLKRKIRQIVDKAQKDMVSFVANQKVIMRTKANRQISLKSINKILQKVMPDDLFNIQKIEHEIQERRLQFKNPPLLDFCRFTYESLKSQIHDLQVRTKGISLQKQTDQELQSIARSKHAVEYRIIGLTRYCEQQLLYKYSYEQDKLLVRNQEVEVRRMLGELQKMILPLKIIEDLTVSSHHKQV